MPCPQACRHIVHVMGRPPAQRGLRPAAVGLHFGDVEKLLTAFFKLRDAGHSVLVVEHHLDVIAAADWVIELGPGGGIHGGRLVTQGPPAAILKNKKSPTGAALARHHGKL